MGPGGRIKDPFREGTRHLAWFPHCTWDIKTFPALGLGKTWILKAKAGTLPGGSNKLGVRTQFGEILVISLGVDGDCSPEIKRHLLLGRKVMTNLDSILKSRDITLPTKVHLVKAMVFPVIMYGCESWTVKKAERRRIDAFEL